MTFDTKMKALLAAVVAAVIAFLIYVQSGLNPAPEPLPSPSPALTSSPSPSPTSSNQPSPFPSVAPSPSASPTPAANILFKGVVGETVGGIFTTDTWLSQTVPPGMKAYKVRQVETLMPSFKGAAIGMHDDPLEPVTEIGGALRNGRYWIEAKLTEPGVQTFGELAVAVVKPGPIVTMPFYMELQHSQVGAAHGLTDVSANQAARFAKTELYKKLLREHGVEPIKHGVPSVPAIAADGTLDLETKTGGVASLKQQLFDGAIFPVMLIGPNLTTLQELTLGAKLDWSMAGWGVTSTQIEAKAEVTQTMVDARHAAILRFAAALKKTVETGKVPAGTWAYAWDEGEGVVDAKALYTAQLLKQTGLKVMETRNVTDAFKPFVDWFFPVVSAVQPGWILGGAYVSCMSQGNCQNKADPSQVAPPSGDPMFVLDAPSVHARAIPWVLARLGAPRGLYFNSTQKLTTAWQPGGLYSEGGNGDGTDVFPGTDGNPWPSLRLKRLYRGLQDQFYRARGAGAGLVTSSKIWPRDEDAFEAERLRIWEGL